MNRNLVKEWEELNKTIDLQYDYNLNENSMVFDVGAFDGNWGHTINKKYGSNIYMFEPVKEFYDNIVKKFKNNEKIKVFNIGFAGEDRICEINLLEYASSTQTSKDGTRGKEQVILKNAAQFIIDNNIDHIDLMKINIEGDEYTVLEKLIRTNVIKRIDNLQIQFHDFIEYAIQRKHNISVNLSKTHEKTWGVEFIWENWKIKIS